MTLRPLPVLALVLLAPLGGASDPLEPAYRACRAALDEGPAHVACVGQVDGGVPGDASDACGAPSPAVYPGTSFHGWLAPPVDAEDDYALHVPAAGLAVSVAVTSTAPGSATSAPARHRVAVYELDATGCTALLAEGAPGAPATFVASAPGVYTLQVTEDGVGPRLPTPPGPAACHLMCLVMNKTGYGVVIGVS